MSDDFSDVRHPRAAVDHRCIWCGEMIPKGDVHAHFAGKWHGEFQDWRMHPECHEDCASDFALEEGFMPYEHKRPRIDTGNVQ